MDKKLDIKLDIKLKIKDATEILGRKGRRIDLIFFGLMLVFVTLLPVFVYSYVEYFIYVVLDYLSTVGAISLSVMNQIDVMMVSSVVLAFLAAVCLLFIASPVYFSFFNYVYKMYRGGIAGKPQFLPRLNDKTGNERNYSYSFFAGMVIFLIFAICLLPLILFVAIVPTLVADADERIIILIKYLFIFGIAAEIVIGFFIFLLFRPLFLFVYYAVRGEKVWRSISLSVKRMRSPRAKQIYKEYIKAFLPSLLLSLATVLVLFLSDTLPKMSLVYFDVADEIIYREQQ